MRGGQGGEELIGAPEDATLRALVQVASASPRKPALTAPSLCALEVPSVASHPETCPSKESGPQAPGKSELPPAPGSGGPAGTQRLVGAWKRSGTGPSLGPAEPGP